MRGGVQTTEDAIEDISEDVPVEVAEVLDVHPRDTEIAIIMETVHTMAQIVKSRDPIIVQKQYLWI